VSHCSSPGRSLRGWGPRGPCRPCRRCAGRGHLPRPLLLIQTRRVRLPQLAHRGGYMVCGRTTNRVRTVWAATRICPLTVTKKA
jgi:hypothetical protein